MTTAKVVVVGDEQVGKSCLIVTHSTGSFPYDRIPILVSASSKYVDETGENTTEIIFFDTSKTRDFDYVRHCLYSGTNAFLLCFSLVDHLSFQNILSRWNPEIRKNCPNTPVILVGLKLDLRQDCTNTTGNTTIIDLIPITYHQGLSMANTIGAVGYVECSAITRQGLNDINKLFDTIFRENSNITDSSTELIQVKGNSSIGNWITAIMMLLLVIIILSCSIK